MGGYWCKCSQQSLLIVYNKYGLTADVFVQQLHSSYIVPSLQICTSLVHPICTLFVYHPAVRNRARGSLVHTPHHHQYIDRENSRHHAAPFPSLRFRHALSHININPGGLPCVGNPISFHHAAPWAPPDCSPPSNPFGRIPIRGKYYYFASRGTLGSSPPREDAQPWETSSPGILPSG